MLLFFFIKTWKIIDNHMIMKKNPDTKRAF